MQAFRTCLGHEYVHHQEAHFTADGPARCGRDARAAAARSDDAGGDGAGADGGRAEAAIRRPVRAARNGARLLGARQGGRGLRVPVQLQTARAVSEARDDPERPAFPIGRAASGRDGRGPLGGGGVPVREQAEEDRRRRRVRRHDDRSDDRAEDRPGQPDAVDAARGRGSGRELEQLRRGLQLHLHEHDLLVGADVAAADGAEPAGRVRAHVRRRQHGRAAGRAPEARSAASSTR